MKWNFKALEWIPGAVQVLEKWSVRGIQKAHPKPIFQATL